MAGSTSDGSSAGTDPLRGRIPCGARNPLTPESQRRQPCEVDDKALARELGRHLDTEAAIKAVLRNAGVEPAAVPTLGIQPPYDYWSNLVPALRGLDRDALVRVVGEASERCPGSAPLRQAAQELREVWEKRERDAIKTALEEHDTHKLSDIVQRTIALALALNRDGPPSEELRTALERELRARLVPERDLEAVWGDVDYKPVGWLLAALERSKCVARIGTGPDMGVGTGFRIPGSWLGDGWADVGLLMTNAHVVSPDQSVREQFRACGRRVLAPEETHVSFIGIDDRVIAQGGVRRAVWSSPPDDLDVTVLELGFDLEGTDAPALYQPVDGRMPGRVNLIGHPHGGSKRFSLQDNTVLPAECSETRLAYRSPTDPGSSGSPIFDNESWHLVGVHRASATNANYGTPMKAILEAIGEPRRTAEGLLEDAGKPSHTSRAEPDAASPASGQERIGEQVIALDPGQDTSSRTSPRGATPPVLGARHLGWLLGGALVLGVTIAALLWPKSDPRPPPPPALAAGCTSDRPLDPRMTTFWRLFERENGELLASLRTAASSDGAALTFAYGPAGMGKSSYFEETYGIASSENGFKLIPIDTLLGGRDAQRRVVRFTNLTRWVCGVATEYERCGELSPTRADRVVSPQLTTDTGHPVNHIWGNAQTGQRAIEAIVRDWDPETEILVLDSLDEIHVTASQAIARGLERALSTTPGQVFVMGRGEALPAFRDGLSEEGHRSLWRAVRLELPRYESAAEVRLRYQNLRAFLREEPRSTQEQVVSMLRAHPGLCEAFRHLVVSRYLIQEAHNALTGEELMWRVGNELMERARETHGRPAGADAEFLSYRDALRSALDIMSSSNHSYVPIAGRERVPYGDHGTLDVSELLDFSGLVYPDPHGMGRYRFQPEWLPERYLRCPDGAADCPQ